MNLKTARKLLNGGGRAEVRSERLSWAVVVTELPISRRALRAVVQPLRKLEVTCTGLS